MFSSLHGKGKGDFLMKAAFNFLFHPLSRISFLQFFCIYEYLYLLHTKQNHFTNNILFHYSILPCCMFSHIDFPQPSGTFVIISVQNAQISLLTLPTATPLPKTYPQLNEIHNVLLCVRQGKKNRY
jgi:hypothetical protein